jgi:hypothetical protein
MANFGSSQNSRPLDQTNSYNRYMDWRRVGKVLGGLALSAVGWIAAPIIKSWLDGTPLNGLRGAWDFWRHLATRPIPLWVGGLAVAAVAGGILIINKWKKRSVNKTDLRIVVLPTPPPRWGVGSMGNTAFLSLTLHARLAHRSDVSLELVSAHLPGTTCVAPFLPMVIAGPYDPSCMIHFGVRPIVAREGKNLKRRVMLVDQFGNEHRTKPITFVPMVHSPQRFGSADAPIQCFFCHQPIALEELSEASHVPAHKKCVK